MIFHRLFSHRSWLQPFPLKARASFPLPSGIVKHERIIGQEDNKLRELSAHHNLLVDLLIKCDRDYRAERKHHCCIILVATSSVNVFEYFRSQCGKAWKRDIWSLGVSKLKDFSSFVRDYNYQLFQKLQFRAMLLPDIPSHILHTQHASPSTCLFSRSME